MKWYDHQPPISKEPLTGHEFMTASAFVQRANAALATAQTKEEKRALKDVKKVSSFMAGWLARHSEEPGQRRLIRMHLATLPKFPSGVAA